MPDDATPNANDYLHGTDEPLDIINNKLQAKGHLVAANTVLRQEKVQLREFYKRALQQSFDDQAEDIAEQRAIIDAARDEIMRLNGYYNKVRASVRQERTVNYRRIDNQMNKNRAAIKNIEEGIEGVLAK